MSETSGKGPLVETPVRIEADGTEAITRLADMAARVVEEVIVPPAKAISETVVDLLDWFRGPLQRARLRNLQATAEEAARLRALQGVAPKPLPLKVTHTIIEEGSFVEDDVLRGLWAQLIVNAQAGMPIDAYYFETLGRLDSEDAAVLAKIAAGKYELPDVIDRLEALGLVREIVSVHVEVDEPRDVMDQRGDHYVQVPSRAELEFERYDLSEFGRSFFEAVSPPNPTTSSGK